MWRSQGFGVGAKCLTLGGQYYFCFGRRFSKHKVTTPAKNVGVMAPFSLRLRLRVEV